MTTATSIALDTGCSGEKVQGLSGAGGVANTEQEGAIEFDLVDDSIHDPRWDAHSAMTQVSSPPPNATPCTQGSQCPTGFCVDGFCCDTDCGYGCMACSAVKKGQGQDGICGSIKNGTDPDNECTYGACNGKNSCTSVNGVACTSWAQCLSGYCVDGFCCNSQCMSSCQACSAAKKGSGYNGVCGVIASGADPDNECTGSQCNGSGACQTAQTPAANGTACNSSTQCSSGNCVDGVCCDTVCVGTCQACTAAKKGSGVDGTCGHIGNDKDPDEECWGGGCDGNGVCKQHNGVPCSDKSQCLSNYCVDGFCCGNICTSVCYACSNAKKGQGYNGVCGPIASNKDPENECNPGECNGSGTCNQPQVLQANGTTCVSGGQCSSGNCVDGYCCDSVCTEKCKACSTAKKGSGANGVCGNIATEIDPDKECNGGMCDGSGACRFYNGAACTKTTECFSNYCVDGYCCGNICTSSCMACSTAKKGSGYNGVCGMIAANSDPDNECLTTCNGSGTCNKAPNGTTCTSGADCTSGFCVDGVCCNSACSGSCDACNLPTSTGTCSAFCTPECTGKIGLPAEAYGPALLTRSQSHSVASADFNGDGLPDLATVDGQVQVVLNSGNGKFAPGVEYDGVPSMGVVRTADLNKDGKPDIIAGNSTGLRVLINTGSSFTGTTYTGGGSAFVAADLNGDGHLDLVHFGADTVHSRYNQGNGSFGPMGSQDIVGLSANQIAAADFNGDGKADLVGTSNGNVAVAMNQGNGTLAALVTYPAACDKGLNAVDVSGDGKPDLVCVSNATAWLRVLVNQGNGAFGAPTNYATGPLPRALVVKDLNADGKMDIAVASENMVSVFANQNNATFAVRVDYGIDESTVNSLGDGITAADFDSNGRMDLATSRGTSIGVFFQHANGGYGTVPGEIKVPTGPSPQSVLAADFNGDGHADIATMNGNGTVSVLLGQGNGSFAPKMDSPAPSGMARAADLNGDGRPDLVVNGSYVLMNQGNGTFGTAVHYPPTTTPYWMTLGDFNGDGWKDLAYAGVSLIKDPNTLECCLEVRNNASVRLNLGNGTFGPSVDYDSGSWFLDGSGIEYAGTSRSGATIAAGDVNGDGKSELIYVFQFDHKLVIRYDAGAANSSANYISFPSDITYGVSTADVTGDGKAETLLNYYGSTVNVLRHDPLPMTSLAKIVGSQNLANADFNGDGKTDLVDDYGKGISLVMNQGNGAFATMYRYPLNAAANGNIAIADFNGDGRPDIVASDATGNAVSLMLSQCLP